MVEQSSSQVNQVRTNFHNPKMLLFPIQIYSTRKIYLMGDEEAPCKQRWHSMGIATHTLALGLGFRAFLELGTALSIALLLFHFAFWPSRMPAHQHQDSQSLRYCIRRQVFSKYAESPKWQRFPVGFPLNQLHLRVSTKDAAFSVQRVSAEVCSSRPECRARPRKKPVVFWSSGLVLK